MKIKDNHRFDFEVNHKEKTVTCTYKENSCAGVYSKAHISEFGGELDEHLSDQNAYLANMPFTVNYTKLKVIAKCSEEDEFNVEKGLKIASARLSLQYAEKALKAIQRSLKRYEANVNELKRFEEYYKKEIEKRKKCVHAEIAYNMKQEE